MDTARIRVERTASRKSDRLRAYKVVLDGLVVGKLKKGESVTLDTSPGDHELHLAIDWACSPKLDLELSAGQETHVRCWPAANPWLASYWTTFGRARYIAIEVTT